MSRDKQIIEEMANDIDKSHWKIEQDFTGCHINSDKIAEYLIKQGWRKQSKGEWGQIGLQNPKCSLCRSYNIEKSNFCPNCGAKMKGGAE